MGGGNAADSYPEHMIHAHTMMLSGQATSYEPFELGTVVSGTHTSELGDGVLGVMDALSAEGSPYAELASYDGSGDIRLAQERIDDAHDALDERGIADVEQLLSEIDDAVKGTLVSEAQIDSKTDHFEKRSRRRFHRMVALETGNLFDLRAVMSSQFDFVLAAAGREHLDAVDEFETGLRLAQDQERLRGSVQLLTVLLQSDDNRINSLTRLAMTQMEQAKNIITAEQGRINWDADAETKDRMWHFQLFPESAKMLSAISGAAVVPQEERWEKIFGVGANVLSMGLQMAMLLG